MKKVEIEVHEYNLKTGIKIEWENGFTIHARANTNTVVIAANKEGLISLAQHLLTLAQEEVPIGHHMHYDEFNSLEEGSCNIIIEKI